jgi:hypothetical protein
MIVYFKEREQHCVGQRGSLDLDVGRVADEGDPRRGEARAESAAAEGRCPVVIDLVANPDPEPRAAFAGRQLPQPHAHLE